MEKYFKKFEPFDLQKARDKWFDEVGTLTDEEISGLFGVIDTLEDRLKMIKSIAIGKG